jgi:DNA-binding transcriptional ArsR family regulator
MAVDDAVARIAAAIGEPARARILFSLMDNHARTATELAVVGEVTPSTASVHLNRLKQENLVQMIVQGKHRYFRLASADVASVLEGLSVLAGESKVRFQPNTPNRLRAARKCYDHMAGTLGVALHDRLFELCWIAECSGGIEVTASGEQGLSRLGINVEEARFAKRRRRFAYGCLDWSERRSHVGGVLGAAMLQNALSRKWVEQDLDSRALSLTSAGRRALRAHLGMQDVLI